MEDNALAGLTSRERDILALIAEGRSDRAICERLFLSPKTVDTRIGSTFAKLGLQPAPDDHRRVLAVLMYIRSDKAGRISSPAKVAANNHAVDATTPRRGRETQPALLRVFLARSSSD